ncbi:MAG: TetR/AcrR family transcriptional regulator [Desulfobacteraceae bacterium]|nr:MAG: TetR/AcrR family transcriptional regulator [Desulfobacteraceae bacterium]
MARQDKRENIVLSAMTLIAEHGFHGASMSMIAEKAGVGIGTIYRYFESRDALIRTMYKEKEDRLVTLLLADYPIERPVRECFFHIGTGVIDYFIHNPLDFRYTEQFHNSPYGVEHRRNRIFASADKPDIFIDLYERGTAQQVIRDMPMVVFFNLAFAPIIWTIRDHVLGFLNLDALLSRKLVESCWDSVKI